MNVIGVGIDLCPIDRMEAATGRHGDRFLRRIFTDAECHYAKNRGDPYASFAARFAAKEAASKALGAPAGIGWHDVEVDPAQSGIREPRLILRGVAAKVAAERGVRTILVSLTHAHGVAAAVALAVG